MKVINKYISALNWKIRDLPADYKVEILKDYENHYKEGLLAGKSENDIILELGDTDLIAKNILEEYYTEHPDEIKHDEKKQKLPGSTFDLFINICNLIFVLPFVFSANLMVISLYVIDYAMILAPILLCLKLFLPVIPITVGFNTDIIWLNVLFALALSAIGFFLYKKFKNYGSIFFRWLSKYYNKSIRFINSK